MQSYIIERFSEEIDAKIVLIENNTEIEIKIEPINHLDALNIKIPLGSWNIRSTKIYSDNYDENYRFIFYGALIKCDSNGAGLFKVEYITLKKYSGEGNRSL